MTHSQAPDLDLVRGYLTDLQSRICQMIQGFEADAHFIKDAWERTEGGGGLSCVLEGSAIEKCGVMFSDIQIDKLPASASVRHPGLAGVSARAMGVSVVCHPANPMAPTAHLNVRVFSAIGNDGGPIWWFGGGFDLTPYYGFEEDCVHWHQVAKEACDPFGDQLYLQYKNACDAYFRITHRDEARGIGGLFFDDVNQWPAERCFELMKSVGDAFIEAYEPILKRRMSMPYTPQQREFQLYRRSRYVEFNLIYDRGTLFGLQSGGRVESILVSMPNLVSWKYRPEFAASSAEAQLQADYLVPRDWLQLPKS